MPRAYTREPTRPDAGSEQTHDDSEWLNEEDREEDVLRYWRDGYRRRRAPGVTQNESRDVGGHDNPTPSTAAVMAVTSEGLDWWEFWPSAEAQQLSACACVRTRADPELCESPLCIGHSRPSEQQAMRASGIANQPAHTAAFPARSPAAKRTADRRLITIGTDLRMLEPSRRVKPRANGSGSIVSIET